MSKKQVSEKEVSTTEVEPKDQRIYEDFCEFVDEFKGESDRAAVILGASKLDQLLGMILEKHLLPCTNNSDQLFTNNGPLGTFSSKIDLSYRLGLISAEFCRAIHLTRRIRNTFAHEVYGARLDNGSHKDRIKTLVTSIKDEHYFSYLKTEFFDGEESARADFSTILGLMVARLDGLYERLVTVQDDNACKLCPEPNNKINKD